MNPLFKIKLTITLTLTLLSLNLSAQDFQEKPTDSFRMLDEFDSVKAFEDYIEDYVQECLDNSLGGSNSVRCFISSQLWDKELNKYYQLLRGELSEENKVVLKDAQLSWIDTKDKTIRMNSNILNLKYNKPGTMFIAIRASEASQSISPIVKQRALLLRSWYHSLLEE